MPDAAEPMSLDEFAAARQERFRKEAVWQAEDRGMVLGVGLALAHLIRTFDQPSMAAEINRAFAYNLATYQRAGLEEYDIRELRKAVR